MNIYLNKISDFSDKLTNIIPNKYFYHADRIIQHAPFFAYCALLLSISFDQSKGVSLSYRTLKVLIINPCTLIISQIYISFRDSINQKGPLTLGHTLNGDEIVLPQALCPGQTLQVQILRVHPNQLIGKEMKLREKSYPSQMTHENCIILNHTNYSLRFVNPPLVNGSYERWDFDIGGLPVALLAKEVSKIEFMDIEDNPSYIGIRLRCKPLSIFSPEYITVKYYQIAYN